MARFQYRAVAPATGEIKSGVIDGDSVKSVLDTLRREGLMPLEALPTKAEGAGTHAKASGKAPRLSGAVRKALPQVLGELAVLIQAGLPLDRALAIAADHVSQPTLKEAFVNVRARVKAGATLSEAMREQGEVFSGMCRALTEAGEASGDLGTSLTRLAETLDRTEALRQTVVSALTYPALLMIVACGVILTMLLVVVPQFETLLSDIGGTLPPATAALMALSRGLREWGLMGAFVLAGGVALAVRGLRQPSTRASLDRRIIGFPLIGPLITAAETARFARTLGGLVESGVALPRAVAVAGRALNNTHMASAIERVAEGLNEGGSLSSSLAATGVFPTLALSFLKTGEETAQLGLMLNRLADILDRDLRTATQRMIAVLTPLVTVVMGLVVAGVIAAIFSAILGINDLAIQS